MDSSIDLVSIRQRVGDEMAKQPSKGFHNDHQRWVKARRCQAFLPSFPTHPSPTSRPSKQQELCNMQQQQGTNMNSNNTSPPLLRGTQDAYVMHTSTPADRDADRRSRGGRARSLVRSLDSTSSSSVTALHGCDTSGLRARLEESRVS